MEIRRDRLVAEFATFERQGNGVVIGPPGIGKTHLFVEHFRAAIAGNRPVFLLPLDKHAVHNDHELQTELGLDQDLIEILEADNRATTTEPGLFLIDSYDALRSEATQQYVRTLIRRAKNVLQTRWRIIVAVRTFDASRSETLLELFPNVGSRPIPEFQMVNVHCRHFAVPALSDDETRHAVGTIPGLGRIYREGSREFRWLLHNPFNLWLAEKLLGRGVDPDALSAVSSEVQLLSLFWHQRVSTGGLSLRRQSVLTDVTRAMVEAHRLSVRLDEVYKREDDETWGDLFSSEVLTRVGTSGQRVAFAHNIIFDFAVSVLLIEDEPARVASFLAAEPARPVFLRPSINYYFTRLWFENRDVFWAVTWFLLNSQQVHLRLFGRLIPMTVVAREVRTVDDLTPIFDALEAKDPAAPDVVLRLLQARRALTAGPDVMWLSIFERLMETPDRRFVWDLTVQTFDAVSVDVPQQLLESAGRIGRSVLALTWDLRRYERWADALGASWAIRLVARTYCTASERGRALLRLILESMGDRTVSVEYVRNITSNVRSILPCDPAFVAEIYARVLSHKETSTEATPMGTPVLPLTSNRRQDFNMCVYALTQHYDHFLSANAELALAGGIRAVDLYIEREHVQPFIKEGHTIDDLTEHFSFGERDGSYVTDISESWSAAGYQDEELQIAARIFQYVEHAAAGGDMPAVDLAIQTLVQRARMAFWWAKLLAVAAQHADVFALRLFPLCIAKPVLSGTATLKQVTDFIAAAYPHWTTQQRESVERAVLELGIDDRNQEWRRQWRQRLLGLIPVELLTTQEARDVRDAMLQAGEQPRNEPLVRFNFGYRNYGEVEWLRDRGADPDQPLNQQLREVSAPLETFGNRWQNEVPPIDAVTAVLSSLEESRRLLQNGGADAAVVAMVRTRVATAAMLAVRSLKPDNAGFEVIRDTLLDAARHPLIETDEPHNEDKDYPAWSPRPETEAAQGLPWLVLREPDREALEAIALLLRNSDAIIRYLAVRELFRISEVVPDDFWSLINDRIENDNAFIVRLGICETLARIAGHQQQGVAEAARQLWTVLPRDQSKRSEFRDILLDIVIWLGVEQGNDWARGALYELARTPMSNPSLLQAAVFQLWHKAIPSRLATHRDVVNEALNLVSEAVHQTCRVLRERDRSHDERDAEKLKGLYGVIDESVSHVYFCFSREHSRDGDATPEAREEFFSLVAPILDEILNFGLDRGFMLAPTIHYFMQLLNEVVRFDARRAVIMAARAARAGETTNYNIDSLAIREVVQLVERVLADHRNEMQDPESLQALMDLLDVFAATGWPEAIQLVWRLDDLFR
jgi:hypothetical protein